MPPMPAPAIRMRGLPTRPPLCDAIMSAGNFGWMQAGGYDARSSRDAEPDDVSRGAVAAAPPCLCGEGPGSEPPLHRGHTGDSFGRHVVRARISAGGWPRGGLLPHLL